MNNILISHREIYDKYKRRSSATIINLINVLNNQKSKNEKNAKISNKNLKESDLSKKETFFQFHSFKLC